MIEIILTSMIIIFVALFFVVARQPADFRITRALTIPAPASAIFAHVNDLHLWESWSPWAKLDPNATNSFEGPASGTGASMKWAGNNKVGVGIMTITDSRPDELIRFRLEFLKPFTATNSSEFLFQQEGNQTNVIWSMWGSNNFVAKAMGLVMNCDKMVGGQFEQGLSSLKSVVESELNASARP